MNTLTQIVRQSMPKKCMRCGLPFTNPIPEKMNDKGTDTEIATIDWCPKCNAVAMSAVRRYDTAYFNLDRVSASAKGV